MPLPRMCTKVSAPVKPRASLKLEMPSRLAPMTPAFKLGLGGPLGNGRQWMSWIHLEDVALLHDYGLWEFTIIVRKEL